ncbi:hypothetical protein XcvCFBP7113P_08490 [Xanthomonas citri pv. vignicola]|nr:hypothetical protein XcvCFBP7113P_08490 [Xanthomonas citri pv. vignicola]
MWAVRVACALPINGFVPRSGHVIRHVAGRQSLRNMPDDHLTSSPWRVCRLCGRTGGVPSPSPEHSWTA